VARRTLRPVREAADAAQAVTEGLLETRLPVSGNDEFAHWHAAFNSMVAALEEKLADLEEARDREQRFTADVAHELRTPLGSLVTASSLLADADDRVPPDLRRPVEIIIEGADRLHRLVEELLELREIDAGQGLVHVDRIDLAQAVRGAVLAHGWEAVVDVRAEVEPHLGVDRWRLDRILVNLISNAIHHGKPPVVVTIDSDGAFASVSVRDHGSGIPAEDLPHLFERYYKASSSRTPGSGGSGLGLSIATENARLLGGRVDVQSQLGEGATFTVVLPCGQPAAEVSPPSVP
jgi:two-component system sensor histidine kinase MtrB